MHGRSYRSLCRVLRLETGFLVFIFVYGNIEVPHHQGSGGGGNKRGGGEEREGRGIEEKGGGG
jgi:hypothetical protein